jgi:hypothetical protein
MTVPVGEQVPSGALVPFLRDYLLRYDTYGDEGGFEYEWDENDVAMAKRADTIQVLSPVTILAGEAGISSSTLQKYLNDERQFISFDIADRLLTAMGRPDLWQVEPLRGVYEALDLDWNLAVAA